MLLQRQKHRALQSDSTAAGAPAAADEAPLDTEYDARSSNATWDEVSSIVQRSSSLGNKPRPPALDLTCIPDLMPDASDLAAAPEHADDAEAAARVQVGDSGGSAAAGRPVARPAIPSGAVKPAQAVVRTPVAQRVLRMNKVSEANDIERVLTCSLCV